MIYPSYLYSQLAEVITERSNLREENRRMSVMIAEAEEVRRLSGLVSSLQTSAQVLVALKERKFESDPQFIEMSSLS